MGMAPATPLELRPALDRVSWFVDVSDDELKRLLALPFSQRENALRLFCSPSAAWGSEGQTEDPALLKGIESVLRAKTEKWVASFTDADKAMYTPVFEKAVGIARQHT